MTSLDVVTSSDGLDALRPHWERLVEKVDVPSPFLSWDWHRAWWQHFGGRRPMRIAVMREQGEVVGIAPFYERRYGPIRALVPFGWPDRLTELIEPILPCSEREHLQTVLNAWLIKEHTVGLVMGLDRSATNFFGDRSLRDDIYFDWRNLPPTWDQLLDGLNRSMRGNIRYYPRLLQRSGHSFSFRVANDVESVRATLPTLFSLHTARAEAPGLDTHRDRLIQPERRAFLHDLAGALVPKGGMKIGVLQVDGTDVAAQLWFERSGTIFAHYSGYAPEWAKFSVAMITTAEIIRLAVERGMQRIEFLRGSKQFKTRWNTEQRVQTDIYFVRYPWLLQMFHRVRSLRRRLSARRYRPSISHRLTEPTAD